MANPRYNKKTTNPRVAKAKGGMVKEYLEDKKVNKKTKETKLLKNFLNLQKEKNQELKNNEKIF
jgi:hypothetical protein